MRLIPEWRSWWRMSSTWFQAAAAAFFSYLTAVPDAAIQLWSILPADLREALPPGYVKWFGVGLIALGIFARLVHQPSLRKRDGSDGP